jgi:hypothetical protein
MVAIFTPCKYPFPLNSFHFRIFNNLFWFYIGCHFEMAAILKILKTMSTTLSDDLFLCQVSKGSAVQSESTADLRNYWTEFHVTWWSYRYMFLVGPKVFSFVVKGVKVTHGSQFQKRWRLSIRKTKIYLETKFCRNRRIFVCDRSPLEEQFCIFKIFKVSAIFKMAAKTRHKKWAVKIQHLICG